MSLVFNMVGGGSGGGSDTYAFIIVTYPAGSNCTASDGTTTLTAPDTSGSWVCKVPAAGTWTVSCTNGTDTASANVSITTEGQSESVALGYRTDLYSINNINPILGSFSNVSSCSVGSSGIRAVENTQAGAYWYFTSPINLRSLGSTLHITIRTNSTVSHSGTYPIAIGAFTSNPTSGSYNDNKPKIAAATQISTVTDAEVDVALSGLTSGTNYYIGGISIDGYYVTQIWVGS